MPANNVSRSAWAAAVARAMDEAKKAFASSTVLVGKGECYFVEEGYDHDLRALTYTICCVKDVGRLFWKRSVSRKMLRIIDIAEPSYDDKHRFSEDYFVPYGGAESLKCELFFSSPRLKFFAECVFEPLAKHLGYPSVEYIDKSSDSSAWYPGEYPELPQARQIRR